MSTGHRTVGRVADILEMIATSPDGLRASVIAQRLGAPKSSTHGLLSGLVAVGYVEVRGGRYFLGSGVNALLGRGLPTEVNQIALSLLQGLQARTGETAILTIRVGNTIVHTHQVESGHPLRYSATLNERRPLGSTSAGKIFLAELPESDLSKVLQEMGEDKPLHGSRLRYEIQATRKEGVAYNMEAVIPGVVGVSSGIYNHDRELVATIGVAGLSERMIPQLLGVATTVRAVAVDGSISLGANLTKACAPLRYDPRE